MTTIRHKTLYLPIKIEADMEARRGLVIVDGIFELNVEPIKNTVTGAEHRARIEIPDGFEFTIAEMASSSVKTHCGIELTNNKGTHSHLAELNWNNSGIIRQ